MKIEVLHLDAFRGQHVFEMRVHVEGECVATMAFSEYEGIPHVSGMEVLQPHRRRGYGSTMVRKLQALYPDASIRFGYMTQDGSALLQSLSANKVANPVYLAAAAEHERCSAQIADFERQLELIGKAPMHERASMLGSLDGWNEATDSLEQAQCVLETETEILTFIEFGEELASLCSMGR